MYTSEGNVSAFHLMKSVALSNAMMPRSALPKMISWSVISGVEVTSRLADNSFCLVAFPLSGAIVNRLLEGEAVHCQNRGGNQ